MRIAAIAIAILALSTATPTAAAVIDFDGFPTGNFAGGTEDGFTLAASNSDIWTTGYGYPTLSFGASGPVFAATLEITRTAAFTFAGLELLSPNFSGAIGPVSVQGYAGITLMATDSFDMPVTVATPTAYVADNLLGVTIDRLVFSFTSGSARTQMLDNIALADSEFPTSTPEPASAALLLAGLAGLAARRR